MSNLRHGMRNTRLYDIWRSMKQRCYNPKTNRYKKYGGRGITVCDEWKDNFQSFYDWAMSNGYSDDLSIDRIDPNGNYESNNCRWATAKQQANNRTNNNIIEFNGEVHTLAQWSEITGIKMATIGARLQKGWSVSDALTIKPLRGANCH